MRKGGRRDYRADRPFSGHPLFFCPLCPARSGRSATRQCAGQLADRLLVLLVLDLGEVASDFEQHALVRRNRTRFVLAQALVKVRDRRIQNAGDLEQPAGRYPVDAAFILMRLLVGNADHLGELLLGQAQHDAALADARSDMIVDRRRRPPSLRLCHTTHPSVVRPGARPSPTPSGCPPGRAPPAGASPAIPVNANKIGKFPTGRSEEKMSINRTLTPT